MPGPILIFDKSFLESLTLNESVWLDNFFLSNIVPTFYIEALADLKKNNKKGKVTRTPDELVQEIVKKTPVVGSCPNVHHRRLIWNDLLGNKVEMSKYHRPVITGGEYKISPDGQIGVNFKQFPEMAALDRWRKSQFLELERDLAHDWRQGLTEVRFDHQIALAKSTLQDKTHFSNIESIREFVEKVVEARYSQFIHLALDLLNIPARVRQPITERWRKTRFIPFNEFAPYAAFVLKLNLFFYLSLDKSFLSTSHKGKPTNIVDLSYLYYLPFCMVFVSNDRLHSKIAPLFMDDKQMFVDGHELKPDLAKLNDYYFKLPQKIKDKGMFFYASYPPKDMETLTGKIFDKFMIKWRTKESFTKYDPIEDKKLLEQLKKQKQEERSYLGPPVSSDQAHHVQISRMVPVQRGDWRILPKGIENHK